LKKQNNTLNNGLQVLNIALSDVELPTINVANLKRSKDNWVSFGKNNQFPNELIKLLSKSTVHQALIEKKRELIVSEGMSYSENIAPFLEAINEYDETIDDIHEKCASDAAIHETQSVFVRYNRQKTKIIALDHCDTSFVRPDKNLDQFGRVQGYWICADWSNTRDNTPFYVEVFNPNNINETTQLWHYKKHSHGQPFYANVSYSSALNYIEAAERLSIFLVNIINNGFYSSAIVEVNAQMTDDQKRKFVADFTSKNTGAENAGKITFIISENKGSVTVTPLSNSDNTNIINAIRNICIAEIATGHRCNPSVAGVSPDQTGFNSEGALSKESMRQFYDVIRGLQLPFLKFVRRVIDFNGVSEYELDITTSASMSDEMDSMMKMDLIKAEVIAGEYGYSRNDIKPSVLADEAVEDEIAEQKEDIITDDALPADESDTEPLL
jgi:hypothetical protein